MVVVNVSLCRHNFDKNFLRKMRNFLQKYLTKISCGAAGHSPALHTAVQSLHKSKIFAFKCSNRAKTCSSPVSTNYSKKITTTANEQNAREATAYFCRAENITSQTVAFIWTFIRPPWAPGIMCCKRHVFNGIRKYCEETEV